MSYNPEQFTSHSNKAIAAAMELAQDARNIELSPWHLGAAIFKEPGGLGTRIATKANVPVKTIQDAFNNKLRTLSRQDPPPEGPPASQRFFTVLREAKKIKDKRGDSHVALDHILQALYEDKEVAQLLSQAGLTKSLLDATVGGVRGERKVTTQNAEETYEALEKYGHNLVKDAADGKLDPVIGRDEEIRRVIQVLSRRTKNNPVLLGEPGVGKTAIVEGLAQRIIRGDVPNTLQDRQVWSLDMGALVAGAVHRGEFEERLKAVCKEVVDAQGQIILFIDEIHLVLGAGATGSGAMDAANILKPMLARGELRTIGATTLEEYRKYVEKDPAFERRFQPVTVNEPSVPDTVSILRGLKPRYESHHGVRILDSSLVIAAQMASRYITNRFLPDKAIDLIDEACANVRVQLDSQPEVIDQLERKQLQLEIEATALEQEKDEASKARLQSVREMLSKVKEELAPIKLQHEAEKGKNVELQSMKKRREAILAKIDKAERNKDLALVADLKYGALPDLDKAIAQQEKNLEEAEAKEGPDHNKLTSEVVTPEKIAEIVSRWTGIPVTKITQSESQRLLRLGDELHRRVVGQEEAVDAVADAVLRSRAGMSRTTQPIASFLFLGPTGVGKTELAKALAAELFDSDKLMVRLDMSEYMEQHAVARLIGAPPGYVGYEQGGQLTEAVRRKPYSVILFDEVEKAHPQVFNVLLQVLDDGRLTDGKGRVVDFTNTVIILTSNLGSEYLLKGIDAQTGEMKPDTRDKVMGEVKKHFRPEFLNRLDDLVIFSPLSSRQLGKIIDIQLHDVTRRLEDRDIILRLDDAAAQYILGQAYDPHYGARPLRRYLEKHVVTVISKMIVGGQLPNNSEVTISVDKSSKLTFDVKPGQPRSRRSSKTERKAMDTSGDGAGGSSQAPSGGNKGKARTGQT